MISSTVEVTAVFFSYNFSTMDYANGNFLKLDTFTAFTQASYRNIKSYFTSKLIEHNKNN